VITGGNAGIGKETAVALARAGWRVLITSRDSPRGAAARDEIRARSATDTTDVVALDLADLASVRRSAAEVLARAAQIDALVNNAGLLLQRRRVTVDGFEETFGVNHLGHFLLTNLLLERLRANPGGARVVVVASQAHRLARGMRFDDLHAERGYRAFPVYAHSKLANLLFTRELARRESGTGVTANASHPGWVDSRFGRDGDTNRVFEVATRIGSLFAVSAEAGARTSVYLASAPELEGVTGGYFTRCRAIEPSAAARDDGAARRLWEVSERLVALSPRPGQVSR
jgi:NAD(P)-dependent dehydrogenase (short-subunit alcohol dehydrogenase family)